MKNICLILALSLLLFSCGKKEENKNALWTTASNFDASNFWINANTISKGNAHSGLYSSKLDSTVEYGIGIAANFENLTPTIPKKVNLHFWIFSNVPNLEAGIVCDPNNNNQPINWQNFGLQSSVTKANEWIEVKASMDLPEGITPESQFRVYFWNPKKQTFYVDDLEITLE